MREPFFVLVAIFLLSVSTANAGPYDFDLRTCSTHEKQVSTLHETYNETQVGIGIGIGGALVEFFANEETGTWTVLTTTADGVSCAGMAGDNYTTGPRSEDGKTAKPNAEERPASYKADGI